jgi:hypothetical protein
MNNATSDQSDQTKADQNKKQIKPRKTFRLFTSIIEAEARSKSITVEEVMKNMRGQYAGTLIPHEEVMRVLLGANWKVKSEEELDELVSEESEIEDKKTRK